MKKLIALLLTVLMVLSLTACASKPVQVDPTQAPAETKAPAADAPADEPAEPAEEPAPEVDLSEHVTLVFYLPGDPPQDEAVIEEALNEKLVEKFNTSIDFQFTTWTDYTTKYNNTLTTGGADMAYIASWLNYQTLSNAGAFLELDDLLNNYAPDLRALAGESMLDQCRVSGELYAIPALWPEYVSTGISYREDLRVKYDLPVPDSVEDAEAYFQGIRDNDPSQPVLRVIGATAGSTGCFTFDANYIFGFKYKWTTPDGLAYGYTSDRENPDELYSYWFSEDFVEDCKLMKKWADAGFWSKSCLSDTNDPDSYKNGLTTAIIAGQNPNKHITNMNDFASMHPDWETRYITYGEVNGILYPGHATQNGTALIRGTKYPKRCMLVLQELMTNEEMNHLVQCGREGIDYEIDENGLYKNLNENFKYESLNTWDLRVSEFKLPQGTDVALQEMFDQYEAIGETCKYPNVNISGGFSEDYTEYQAERTAVMNVVAQYLVPIQAGLVEDVDAAIAEFQQKVMDAGLEVCRENYKAQWEAYCAEFNYD